MKNILLAAMAAFFTTVSCAQGITQTPGWAGFESFVFDEQSGHRTHSLVILKGGKIVFERHRPGFTPRTAQQVWSISKSVSGLLIGLAIEDKLLSAEDSLQKFFPEASRDVTINHLLNMTSGLEWNEGYEYNPIGSDVIRMLYTANYSDMASYAAHKPLEYPVATHFKYSSGTTNILMGILARATGPGDYAQYPWRRFFDPLEITSATWERDGKGTFVGSSYLYISPADLAKIGNLFLSQGQYKGKQIVPLKWLERSKTLSPFFEASLEKDQSLEGLAYSTQWWLNAPLKRADGTLSPHHPDLPTDAILALGHWGQMMVIIPSHKVVLVRTGADKRAGIDRNKFFDLFMRALEQASIP